MANVKISQLPDDDTLSGSEKLTGIDGSTNKNISINQIAAFVDANIGSSVPDGGDTGQVLAKASDDDGDVEWVDQTGGSGADQPFTVHTGTTWNGTLKYRVLNANLALTLVTALQSGMILFKQDATGGRTVSIDGEDMPINLTPEKWSSVGFARAGAEYLLMTNPNILSIEGTDILDTPSFSADAVSDDEIDLTSITYDSDSEAMTIERATNAGFTTGLTEIYSGVPKSSHSDTGLTASTHYYYRIQTTASGFTDSDYGYDDDTTDASGLTQLSTPGSFSLVADSATTVTCTWADIANETNFSVQIATNAGFSAGVQSATKAAGVLTHQFTGLTPGTTYYGHVKGIGDGVTFSDSAYSTTDNDTTPAVTLNAPTSFAAGTPTADGCPFTWNDTNSSPNESSLLIQIAAAADTTYSSVIATRTPAANATSAAAGTGLTASTNYRARIKNVGNGTSTNDSAWSSEVTFSTAAAAVTLNAPTSFAAGTPTSSGVPSTWTDTNTAPAESSYLIQIAAAADTTYTTVIDTRTPAANATSDAGGTGLSPSTAYRMRIKSVGNGTTTLDSAYSTDVTFSTASGSIAALDFTDSTDIIASGSDWVFDPTSGIPAYGNLGMATDYLPAGDDGRIMMKHVTTTGSNLAFLGFVGTNVEAPYSGMLAGFSIQSSNGEVTSIDGGTPSGSPVATLTNGDYCCVYRTGSTLKLQKATATIGPWTDLVTLGASSAGDLYVTGDMIGGGGGNNGKFHEAKGDGLTAIVPAFFNLVFTGSTGVITAGGNDWKANSATPAYGNLGKANRRILAGTDGRLILPFDGVSEAAAVALHTSNVEIAAGTMNAGLSFNTTASPDEIYKIDGGAAALVVSAPTVGYMYCIHKYASGAHHVELSRNNGIFWHKVAVFTYTSAADGWVVADIYGDTGSTPTGLLASPQAENSTT